MDGALPLTLPVATRPGQKSGPVSGQGSGPASGVSLVQQVMDLRPLGGFRMVMADPPWSFENWSAKGEAKNPKAHYPCMPLAQIKAMPVAQLAAEDCVLWLWATHPMLPQAIDTLAALGFAFKTSGVWVKRTVHGRDGFGPGYWLRTASEPFLIGTRGSPKPGARHLRSAVASYGEGVTLRPGAGWSDTVITIEAPAREHSRKPEAAFAAAEALAPEGPRIELFSRASRPGWSAWGLEAGKFDAEAAACAR